MRVRQTALLLAVAVAGALAVGASRTTPVVADSDVDKTVVMRDDCDPSDPTYPGAPCALQHGDVTLAEFNGELASPLSLSVIGHQAWRNDPPYLQILTEQDVKVTNRGGRVHTFTEVAAFGGGRVPPLNQGLTPAPECLPPATVVDVAPGANIELAGLGAGNHRFQCCIHPWMRAVVKVGDNNQ